MNHDDLILISINVNASFGDCFDCHYVFDSLEEFALNVEKIKTLHKKTIIILNYISLSKFYNKIKKINIDLSWVNLISIISFEFDNFNILGGFDKAITRKLKNNNTVYVLGGIYDYNCKNLYFPWLYDFPHIKNRNEPLIYNIPNDKKYYFDCLMGRKRPHRIKLFKFLKQNNLLDKCLISINDDYAMSSNLIENYISSELITYENEKVKSIKTKKEKYNNYEIDVTLAQTISPQVYNNSWFSIVSETLFTNISDQKYNYITEKTAKCLFAQRIFICFALPNHLKCLRDLGFKTFDGIIDESYDSENDHNKRFEMITNLIKWLLTQDPIKLYKEAEPILMHNFKTFLELDTTDHLKKFVFSHIK